MTEGGKAPLPVPEGQGHSTVGKDELRDIYSIGLKTLIADVPPAMGPSVCRLLTRRLLSGVAAPPSAAIEIKLECLDNLTDLIRRFGQEFEADHAQIMDTVLMQLSHDKPAVKKRATACLSSLAVAACLILAPLFHVVYAQVFDFD